jgi:hypothetical protein
MTFNTLPYGAYTGGGLPGGGISAGSSFLLPDQSGLMPGGWNPLFAGSGPMSFVPTGIGPSWNPLYAAVPGQMPMNSGFTGGYSPAGPVNQFGGVMDGLFGLDPSLFQQAAPKQESPDIGSMFLKAIVMASVLRSIMPGGREETGFYDDPNIGPIRQNPRQPRGIAGPAETTYQDGAWSFSGAFLTKVSQQPEKAKELITKEVLQNLTNGDKTKDLTFVLKELTGQEIQTAEAHHRKKVEGYGLFDDIMNKLTKNVLNDIGQDPDQITGPDKDQIDPLGGVQLSRATIEALQKDQDPKSLDVALLKIEGVTSKAQLMAKVINNPKYDEKYFTAQAAWCNEMYTNMVNGMLARYKKA